MDVDGHHPSCFASCASRLMRPPIYGHHIFNLHVRPIAFQQSEKGGHDSKKTYSLAPDTAVRLAPKKLTERPLIVSYRQLVRGDHKKSKQEKQQHK